MVGVRSDFRVSRYDLLQREEQRETRSHARNLQQFRFGPQIKCRCGERLVFSPNKLQVGPDFVHLPPDRALVVVV